MKWTLRNILHGLEIVIFIVGMVFLLTRQYDGSGIEQTAGIKLASVAIWAIFMAIISIVEFFFQFWTNLIKRNKWSQNLLFPIVMLVIIIVIIILIVLKLNIY